MGKVIYYGKRSKKAMRVPCEKRFVPGRLLGGVISPERLERLLAESGCLCCFMNIAPYEEAVVVQMKDKERGLMHVACCNGQPVKLLKVTQKVVGKILGVDTARKVAGSVR